MASSCAGHDGLSPWGGLLFGGLLVLCDFQRSFLLGFSACFTTVPVDFFFLSRNRLRPANLAAAFGDHKFRLFSLDLFAHTNKHTHAYGGALFSHNSHTHTHTVTVARPLSPTTMAASCGRILMT